MYRHITSRWTRRNVMHHLSWIQRMRMSLIKLENVLDDLPGEGREFQSSTDLIKKEFPKYMARNDGHHYSRFQLTFHCNIPNFVAKFGSSLRSSKVHFRIRKPVCKQRLWLVPELSEANQMLSLQTGLRILKWTFELRNEFPNFATKFGMLQWKVTWNRL